MEKPSLGVFCVWERCQAKVLFPKLKMKMLHELELLEAAIT